MRAVAFVFFLKGTPTDSVQGGGGASGLEQRVSASASNRHVPFHHATFSTLHTGACRNVQVQREV